MNNDLIIQAIEAYFNVCKDCTPVFNKDGQLISGLIYQQPALSDCTVGRKYVYLRNCNGEIARYNIKTETITV